MLRIPRGLPHLRTLRQITGETYRLFDRRCRTTTALAKLATLRQRVQRFAQLSQILKELFSANEDKLHPCHRPWYVESTYEVLERVTSAIKNIDAKHKQENIILVTHGDAAHILLSGYLNINPGSHRQRDLLDTGQLKLIHDHNLYKTGKA